MTLVRAPVLNWGRLERRVVERLVVEMVRNETMSFVEVFVAIGSLLSFWDRRTGNGEEARGQSGCVLGTPPRPRAASSPGPCALLRGSCALPEPRTYSRDALFAFTGAPLLAFGRAALRPLFTFALAARV